MGTWPSGGGDGFVAVRVLVLAGVVDTVRLPGGERIGQPGGSLAVPQEASSEPCDQGVLPQAGADEHQLLRLLFAAADAGRLEACDDAGLGPQPGDGGPGGEPEEALGPQDVA